MALKTIIVILGIILLGFLESLFPKEEFKISKKIKRISKNIFFWLINIGLTPIIILPITITATNVQIHEFFNFENKILLFLFHLIILDLFLYWWHRANHEISFLWKFHHVHHLDETLDITSGVRFHFGEVILSALVRSILIILFNITLTNLLIIEGIILISSIFHHSNINLNKKIENLLSLIIVTPSIHWVHHHQRKLETDSNYSTIFSLWDKLFKSRSKFKRKIKMPIGVQGDKEQSLIQLIVRPFFKN